MNNKTKAEFAQIKYELLSFQKYRDSLFRETIPSTFLLFVLDTFTFIAFRHSGRTNQSEYLFVCYPMLPNWKRLNIYMIV